MLTRCESSGQPAPIAVVRRRTGSGPLSKRSRKDAARSGSSYRANGVPHTGPTSAVYLDGVRPWNAASS